MLASYKIASSIHGLRVTRAYRSFGSMIHFEFGSACSGQPLYRLMVETARWEIKRRDVQLAADVSWETRIDQILRGFLNRRTQSVQLNDRCSVLNFENGLTLKLSPGPARNLVNLDNWVIFRDRTPALWLAPDRRLRSLKIGQAPKSDHH